MKQFILTLACLLWTYSSIAQVLDRSNPNYDESKVPDYILPDPLICNDGTRVTTVKQCENQRRAELLEIFSSQMYGRTPDEKITVTYETLSENPDFMNGKATCKQVKRSIQKT